MEMDEFLKRLKIKKLSGRPRKKHIFSLVEIKFLEMFKEYKKGGYLFYLDEAQNGNKE